MGGIAHLFVYGTLIPEAAPTPLEGVMRDLRQVGRGWIPGHLYDLGRYPGAVPDPRSGTRIRGEVFELPEDPVLLDLLDRYEGCIPEDPQRSLFVRVESRVHLEDDRTLACWVYAYRHDPGGAPRVHDGDYLAHRRRQVPRRNSAARPTSRDRSSSQPNSGK